MKYNPDKNKDRPEKKVEKVISGTAKVRKKSELRKAADKFVAADITDVKSFVIRDIVIPSIKDLLYSGFTGALNMLLFDGDDRRRKDGKKNYSGNYISSSERRRSESRSSRIDLDELTAGTRSEAEDVLDQMYELLSEFGVVSISDYLDMLGVDHDYTYDKYGWTNLRNVEIGRDRHSGEYYLRLPRPKLID